MFRLLSPAGHHAIKTTARAASFTARRAIQTQAKVAAASTLKPLLWSSAIATAGVLAWQSSIKLDAVTPLEEEVTSVQNNPKAMTR
jgi:hypothetical protein